MAWYKCTQGHVFEVKTNGKRVSQYFCALCQKIYVVGKELIRLVKYRKQLFPINSAEGRSIINLQARQKAKQKEHSRRWKAKHGKEQYYGNRESNLQAAARYAQAHRQEIADWKAKWRKDYESRPGMKAWRREYKKAMRWLARLGLGVSPDAKTRPCPQCARRMAKMPSGSFSCPACSYWLPPVKVSQKGH